MNTETILILLCWLLCYSILWNNKIRLWRIIGYASTILLGFTLVMVADQAVFWIASLISLMVSGIKMLPEIARLSSGE